VKNDDMNRYIMTPGVGEAKKQVKTKTRKSPLSVDSWGGKQSTFAYYWPTFWLENLKAVLSL